MNVENDRLSSACPHCLFEDHGRFVIDETGKRLQDTCIGVEIQWSPYEAPL